MSIKNIKKIKEDLKEDFSYIRNLLNGVIRDRYINIFVFLCISIFIIFEITSPYFSLPTSEEKLYSAMAIKNFINHGAHSTSWLPNYTTRENGLPFVYTHLNDFPSQIGYMLIKIGFKEQWLRFIYLSATILSFFLLYRTAYSKYGIYLTLGTLGFLYSKYTLIFADHLHVPLSYLAHIFAFVIALNRKESPVKYFALMSLTVVFSAFFSWFVTLNIIIFILLLALLDYQGARRYFVVFSFIVLFLFLCLAKIYWNGLYLGSYIARQEIVQTISNRIFGAPTASEMFDLFNSHGIVLWGYQLKKAFILFDYFNQIFWVYIFKLLKICLLILILYLFNPKAFKFNFLKYKSDILTFIIFIVSLSGWSILFPAHANGYSNPVLASFYSLVICTLPLLVIVQISRYSFPIVERSVCLIFLLYFILNNVNFFNKMDSYSGQLPVEMQEFLSGKSIYTNISSIFLGYSLPSSFIFGRCEPTAISNFDSRKCYNFFENVTVDAESKYASEHPEFFVFSKDLLSGNSPWTSPIQLEKYKEILYSELGAPVKIFIDGPITFEVYKLR